MGDRIGSEKTRSGRTAGYVRAVYDALEANMATTVTRRATEADLWDKAREPGRHELVDGEIRSVSPAGGRHGAIGMALGSLLVEWNRDRRAGTVFDSSTGFRMPNGNVRSPDVAFVSRDRLHDVPEGFCPLAPDLAVEVVSPGDRPREVLDKVGEYLQAGTRLVWVVDPDTRTVAVHRTLSDVLTVAAGEALEGGAVLPGFACRPADFL